RGAGGLLVGGEPRPDVGGVVPGVFADPGDWDLAGGGRLLDPADGDVEPVGQPLLVEQLLHQAAFRSKMSSNLTLRASSAAAMNLPPAGLPWRRRRIVVCEQPMRRARA